MARSITRPLVVALLAVAAALALVGCGGGGGGKDLSAGLTPRQLLDRSAAEAAKLQSFRILIDGTGRIDLAKGAAVPGAELLNGPITLSGEGPVQPPDRASIDAKLELASFSPQVNLTRVGDDVFLGLLGQDFRLTLPASQVRLLDFGALYPTLTGWMKDPVTAGREDIDGSPTVKVTGAVDAAAAFADLAPLLQAGGSSAARVPPARLRAALKEGTVEAWIGTRDLRPRRVHIVLKADGTGIVAGVGAIDLDLTATLSAFDEPVDIQAPRNPRELDLNQLGSLAGGG
jgi:hypothetical protein